MKKNYYQKFGISEDASLNEIEEAYLRLAIKYHPDEHGGNKKYKIIFEEINKIYHILSDVQKRLVYDLKLRENREERCDPIFLYSLHELISGLHIKNEKKEDRASLLRSVLIALSLIAFKIIHCYCLFE